MPSLILASSTSAHNTVVTLGFIAAILGIIVLVLNIIHLTRRKPSHTDYTDREVSRVATLARNEVSRVESRLDDHILKHSGAIGRLHQKVEDQGKENVRAQLEISRQMEKGFRDLATQIGYLQGKSNPESCNKKP